jgi:hypothetical protein
MYAITISKLQTNHFAAAAYDADAAAVYDAVAVYDAAAVYGVYFAAAAVYDVVYGVL